MDANDPGKLEDLVATALARIEEEGLGVLDELCGQNPDAAEDLRARVEWLLETGLVEISAAPKEYPERLGDFRLIEPIGQGGMGVVYRAEQLSLGREVALKLVRPEQLYFPGALQRFQNEVETVAALAHPGIVPVYSVGQEEGVPFFAMEHVQGASLSAVITNLGEREPRQLDGTDLLQSLEELGADSSESPSSLFEGPWPTLCTRMIREVAEALEHAHRRGVLHRDVKPSNIMITRGGRVMLLDFGLSSSGSGDQRHTKTGQRVGTLAYMAPEQMRGERELDARVDVFALGVALYELLTLSLPHASSSEADRLANAGVALPANLRKVDPRVPWELETVVQTATDPDPARRYSSAADFAHDLGNVLEHRPIEARRASTLLRAQRWVQRHPAIALAILVMVVAPSLFAVQEMRANSALSQKGIELEASNTARGKALDELRASNAALEVALDDATEQREAALLAQVRAEQHFERAYEAIELMLGRVGGEVLEGVPRMEAIRRSLLEDALRLHEELLDDPAVDRSQPRIYAKTLRRTAALRAELGQLESALETLGQEAGILDRLLADTLASDLVLERGKLDFRRAEVCKLLGRYDVAEEYAHLAIARLARLAKAIPDRDPRWSLARARTELAEILGFSDRTEEAREELREASSLMRDLLREEGSWDQRQGFARVLHQMAGYPESFLGGSGGSYDPVAGEPFLREAFELRQALSEEEPENAQGLFGLAQTGLALGGTLVGVGRFAEGRDAFRASMVAYKQLAEAFPARPSYTDGLATARYNLSLIAAATGDEEERRALLEGAIEGFEALEASATPPAGNRLRWTFALGQLGQALFQSEPETAEGLLEQSLELGLPLWHEGRRADLRTALAWSTGILGSCRLSLGDATGTVKVAVGYLDLDPTPIEVAWAAGLIAGAVGIGRSNGMNADTLAEWTDDALSLVELAADRGPNDPGVRKELVDPTFASIQGEERYLDVLEALGIRR